MAIIIRPTEVIHGGSSSASYKATMTKHPYQNNSKIHKYLREENWQAKKSNVIHI